MDNNMKNAIPQLGQDTIEAFAELLGETAEELISEISNREKKFSDLDENSICVPYYIAKEACDIIIPFIPKNVVLDLYPRVIQLPVPVIDIRKWYDDAALMEEDFTAVKRPSLCFDYGIAVKRHFIVDFLAIFHRLHGEASVIP